MKTFIPLVFLIFSTSIGFSQDLNSIDKLIRLKNELTIKLNMLQDSIEKVEQQINLIKSEKIFEKISNSELKSVCVKNAKLKLIPHVHGEIIKTYLQEEIVVILDYKDGYFGVGVGSDYGYMSDMWIKKTEDILIFIETKKNESFKLKVIAIERDRVKKDLENERDRVKKDLENKKLDQKYLLKFGKAIYDKLKSGYYWIGMTAEMAIYSLGEPNDINRTVGSWGVHSQWVYNSKYLYFENGILASWQD